jgi:hypothetical protein
VSVPPDAPGTYDRGLSAKKAGNQTLMSYLAVLATLLTTLLASPDLMAQVLSAVARYPKAAAWVVGFFGVARFALAFWRDYQKHQDPSYHMEHGVLPKKAEALAVASGADPAEARKETAEAVKERAEKAS